TGRGATAGVLVKNAEALEVLAKVDTLVVDKTGTLTEGKPRVVTVVPMHGASEEELLRTAASLESSSEHPLAAAVIEAAKSRGIALAKVDEFRSLTGKGVTARLDGRRVALGSTTLTGTEVDALRGQGQTVVEVVVEDRVVGILGIADPIKSS